MREVTLERNTNETQIELTLNLDGAGRYEVDTGCGFLNHMLELFARHGRFDLVLTCHGDVQVDYHHTTEDVGIAMGQAIAMALDDKKGITRYADCLMPMDETLCRLALDISGRSFLVFKAEFPSEKIGTFDVELVREFFQALASNAHVTLHAECLYGLNSHHIAEGLFKGLARVLRKAVEIDQRAADRVPSTKGTLSI